MRLRDKDGYTIVDGHDLAREIIAKHGIDRYPSEQETLLKLVEEVGELIKAYWKQDNYNNIAKEYADVGLTLYSLGNKAYLNLEECMARVVREETRKFA